MPSKFKKNKTKYLFSDKAYFLIKKIILNLKVLPNDPLSELKLASMLKMSRTPIRDALKRLKVEGIITSYGKKGYFPNIPTLKEIKDLYEVRILLEGAAVKLAVNNIDLNRLEYFENQFFHLASISNSEDKEQNITDKEGSNSKILDKGFDLVKLGREFHCFIIESTENEKLKEFLRNIYDQLDVSRAFSYQRRRKEAANEHLRIIKALKERDGENSQLLIVEHLRKAFDMLTKIL